MESQVIIASGIMRSGSTWVFQVCCEVACLLAERMGKPFVSTHLGLGGLEYFFRTRANDIPGPIVIKTHWTGALARQWVSEGRSIMVYSYRDPRDCVASDMKFMCHDLSEAIHRIAQGFRYFPRCPSQYCLLVPYEEMIKDTRQWIKNIAKTLGIELTDAQVQTIDDRTNVAAARKICNDLAQRNPAEILLSENHLVDPRTHLHDNHIDSAKVGRWKEDLTVQQLQTVTRLFHHWLVKLGYELPTPNLSQQLSNAFTFQPKSVTLSWPSF